MLSNGNHASSNENTMRSMCDISQRLFELSVASLPCLFAVETLLYLLLKHVPVDPFISFSFIHSSLTFLKGKKVNFAYYKLKGTVSQGFCSRLTPLKSQ